MKNYLIIGGGLAGITFAHQLLKNGLSFDLVDNRPTFNSSIVAAGFWNPIVFKRLTMSYNADILLPLLIEFYKGVEEKLATKFIYNIPQLKIFNSKEERYRFIDKAIVSEVSTFLDEQVVEAIRGIDAPYGMGKVIGTGYINTNEYIVKSLEYFDSIDSFKCSYLEYSELTFSNEVIEYEGQNYGKVIFCEGYQAVKNPFFKNINLKPTKGELLILKIPELTQNFAFAKSAGLIPIGNKCFIAGSTYDWEDMTEAITEDAKNKLLYNLKDFLKLDYIIIDHQAGIRPSSYDRRPIIGQSEVEEKAFILNGFGTKGVMYAPYYSWMLLDYIENQKELEDEVDYVRIGNLDL